MGAGPGLFTFLWVCEDLNVLEDSLSQEDSQMAWSFPTFAHSLNMLH